MAQANKEGKEKALYYLNRTLTKNKMKYSPVEKVCLALFYAIKKLTHYFEAYSIKLISLADPVKFVMSRHVLSERFAKWSIVFNQYEIDYVFQKVVKGQALANFLADHPMPTEWEMSDDFPDDDIFSIEILLAWTMFFDGARYLPALLERRGSSSSHSRSLSGSLWRTSIWSEAPPYNQKNGILLANYGQGLPGGLDVVGPITPKSSIGHIYILAATDYFLKWAEAVPLKEVKKETVVHFIHVNINFRYGVPQYISSLTMEDLLVNGLAKAVNKTFCNLLKKVVSKLKRDCHEKIGEALWMYQTTHRTATQSTPYSLVHGVEAVLLESQIPSLCIAI
ncbi:UNVERIFIED_CONTAM: hypothetical protein Scaly_1613700 [Sesamum calycinum]|uniref:Reverse transcriptase RNase H-like domain-containing protein n=1 Tax=Sesamum calycinum TaxID=2727403 RepID=A0AAW2P872_9LAMI